MGLKILMCTDKNGLYGIHDIMTGKLTLPWVYMNNSSLCNVDDPTKLNIYKEMTKIDMKIFKQLTSKPVNGKKPELIMGRLTHESIGGVLPGRKHIVITSYDFTNTKNIIFYKSIKKAIRDHPDAWVIGGYSLIKEILNEHPSYIGSIRINQLDFTMTFTERFNTSYIPLDELSNLIRSKTSLDVDKCFFSISRRL